MEWPEKPQKPMRARQQRPMNTKKSLIEKVQFAIHIGAAVYLIYKQIKEFRNGPKQ